MNPSETFVPHIEGFDQNWVQFDFLDNALFPDAIGRVDHGLNGDLDKVGNDEWLFHLDAIVIAEDRFYLHLRSSYKLTMPEEYIFTHDILKDMIKHTFELIYQCAEQLHKERKRQFNDKGIKLPEASLEQLISGFIDIGNSRVMIGDDKSGLNKTCYTIERERKANFLAQGTVRIMDNILFNNPAFDRKKNKETITDIIPLSGYITLRNIINKKGDALREINTKKFIIYLVCIDCACQLLTGDHFEKMENDLDSYGLKAPIRKEYLAAAQELILSTKEHLKKINSHFPNLEEYHDWNKLIS